MVKPQIVGISGTFGSGKSTAADFLTSLGYTKISLAQFLEDALLYSGEKNITRKKLQDLGNSWRELHGSGVLGKKAVEYIEQNKPQKVVVEGFRNIGEIEEIKKAGKFTLLGIVVNRSIRYKRLMKLKRREKLTPELFEKLDYRDMGLGEKITGLQVAVCIAVADIFLENNKTEKDLFKKLKQSIRNK